MSVLSMSAKLAPSQVSEGSPEALLNGRIAREACTVGAFAGVGAFVCSNKKPVAANISTANPTLIFDQGRVLPNVPSEWNRKLAAAPVVLMSLRSAKRAAVVW